MPGALWHVAEMMRAVLEVTERARTGLWWSQRDGWQQKRESISGNWLCEALPSSGFGSGFKGLSAPQGAGGQEAMGEHEAFVIPIGFRREAWGGRETFWPGFRE